ncbi:MAG: hypothetical protein MJ252_29465 [archaeon]|nr:hypothetical protein [archaeon]
MQKPIVFNRFLNEKYSVENNLLMKTKLEKVKPKINMKCPESFAFYKNQFRRTSQRDNLGKK